MSPEDPESTGSNKENSGKKLDWGERLIVYGLPLASAASIIAVVVADLSNTDPGSRIFDSWGIVSQGDLGGGDDYSLGPNFVVSIEVYGNPEGYTQPSAAEIEVVEFAVGKALSTYPPEVVEQLGLKQIVVADCDHEESLLDQFGGTEFKSKILEDDPELVMLFVPFCGETIVKNSRVINNVDKVIDREMMKRVINLLPDNTRQQYFDDWRVLFFSDANGMDDEQVISSMQSVYVSFMRDPQRFDGDVNRYPMSRKANILRQIWQNEFPIMDGDYWQAIHSGEDPFSGESWQTSGMSSKAPGITR